MREHGMPGSRPKVAIVDANTLAVLGLKQILQEVIPIMTIDTFGSFGELESSQADQYAHFFVAMDIVVTHRSFFLERQRKTIVLTLSLNDTSLLHGFHSLCINQSESQLIKQILTLQQHAHHGGRNLPPMPKILQQKILTCGRENKVRQTSLDTFVGAFYKQQLQGAALLTDSCQALDADVLGCCL